MNKIEANSNYVVNGNQLVDIRCAIGSLIRRLETDMMIHNFAKGGDCHTQIVELQNLLNEIDMVLIMTVEPGFGGQSFMANMMDKVREARREIDRHKFKDIWLQVDGGISLETISTAFEAGADTFVAGSAVFKDQNPGLMVDKLRAKIS